MIYINLLTWNIVNIIFGTILYFSIILKNTVNLYQYFYVTKNLDSRGACELLTRTGHHFHEIDHKQNYSGRRTRWVSTPIHSSRIKLSYYSFTIISLSFFSVGQVSAVTGIGENVIPIFCGPLYSYVYESTVGFFPSAYFLVTAAITVPTIFLYL